MMKFKPLNGNLLIDPVEVNRSPSGLLLPDSKEDVVVGLVVKSTLGRYDANGFIECDIQENESVYYDVSFAREILISGKKYHLVDFLALWGKEEL
jgi:co-chaperonin GroES (HSP10)